MPATFTPAVAPAHVNPENLLIGNLVKDKNGNVYMVINTPTRRGRTMLRLTEPTGFYDVAHEPPYVLYEGEVTIRN